LINFQFCRKETTTHQTDFKFQHIRLIYQNFTGQLTKLHNQLDKFKTEISKANDEVSSLKEQNAKLTTELIEFKDGSKCKISESTSILKQEIELIPDITDVISLINDDNALYITLRTELYPDEADIIYKEMCFDTMINRLGLHRHMVLLTKLFHKVQYHLYHVTIPYYQCHYFCFPFHLEDIEDFHFSVPGVVEINIYENALWVSIPEAKYIEYVGILYVGSLQKKLSNRILFNLLNKSEMQLNTFCPFADGYACIKFDVREN